MEGPHLDREVLSRFTAGRLPPDEARRVDQHLSICAGCRDRADEVSLLDRLEFLDALLNPSYDKAFERAIDRTAEQLAGLRDEARSTEDLFTELSREPSVRRRHRIVTEEKFHSLKFCQLLQSRSRENWFQNPTAALEWAELAVAVAQRLDQARYGTSLVQDSRAISWAYVGNANRILSDLWRAEQSLHQAWLCHFQAGEDLTTETELLSITSSLRIAQNRTEDAVRLVDREIVLHREGQQRHAEGYAFLLKGKALSVGGRSKDSVDATSAGIQRIDPDNQRLVLLAKYNMVSCLFHGGSWKEALCLFRENRSLYSEVRESYILANLRWLEGKLLACAGRFGEAKPALFEAQELILERQTGLQFFNISLDLAYVLLREGRRRAVRELLKDIIPLGERVGGSPQEILLARWFYAQASRG
jgi:tetratricopeptide (TPR) repeat protein